MVQRCQPADGNRLIEEDTVPAYMIVEVETTAAALMAEYRKHPPGLVAKFGGKFIVRGGKTRTLEGGWTPPRVVVLEFPSYEAAERFYESPEYKPVLEMRLKAGKSRALTAAAHNGCHDGRLSRGRHPLQRADDRPDPGAGHAARRGHCAGVRVPSFPPPASRKSAARA